MRLGGEGLPVGCSASEGSCGLSTCRWYHVSIYVRPWEEDGAGQGGLRAAALESLWSGSGSRLWFFTDGSNRHLENAFCVPGKSRLF